MFESSSIEKVEYVKNIYEKQQEKVKKEQYLEGLLLEDYVCAIRNIPNPYHSIELSFVQAGDLIRNKCNGVAINVVKQNVSQDFLDGNEVELTSIFSYGFENYAYGVRFKLCNEELEIFIPMRNKIRKESLHYAHYGKFVVFIRESFMSWTAIYQSYKIEEVADFLKQWKMDRGEL